MSSVRGVLAAALAASVLTGCASIGAPVLRASAPVPRMEPMALAGDVLPTPPANSLDGLIARYAAEYAVPEPLIRRIIARESGYNPRARHGPYYGLMQIRYDTAQSMGYRGPASGLLDADTNLRYGVKYLSGAYRVGEGDTERAVRNYAHGYYYDAKRKGLLEEVGLR